MAGATNEVANERADQPLLNPVANGGYESSNSEATTTSDDNHMPANGHGHVQHSHTVSTVVVKNGSSGYKKISSDDDTESYYDQLGDAGLTALELPPKDSGLLEQKSVKKEAIWNLVSTIIGGGILALPYVMKQAGLVSALLLFVIVGCINVYTLQLLCDCGRAVRQNDVSLQRRVITYVIVAEKAYPGKWLRSFVLISIFLFCFMTVLGYFVALADIIPDIIGYFRDSGDPDVDREEDWFDGRVFPAIITLVVSLPLSLIRFIAKLWWLSLVAFLAIFILVLCVITRGFETVLDADYPNNLPDGAGELEYFRWDLELFSAISVITFAYTCHVNLFPVFSELKLSMSTDRKQTMLVGLWAVVVSGVMYCVTGVFGYLQFRQAVKQNIVESLNDVNEGDEFLLVGQMGLVAMLTMSIILLGFPARRMMILLLRGTADNTPLWFEAIVSSTMLGIAFVLSLFFQQIGQIWSLAGAFLGTLIAFTLPCMFYLKLKKNNQWFIDREAKLATFVAALSLVLMVIGSVEAVRDFVANPPSFSDD